MEKLLASRRKVEEDERGYQFQFSVPEVLLEELAAWVAAESKCCPFFNFHIDLEQQGRLLSLRRTGENGIKPFIRSEFHVFQGQ